MKIEFRCLYVIRKIIVAPPKKKNTSHCCLQNKLSRLVVGLDVHRPPPPRASEFDEFSTFDAIRPLKNVNVTHRAKSILLAWANANNSKMRSVNLVTTKEYQSLYRFLFSSGIAICQTNQYGKCISLLTALEQRDGFEKSFARRCKGF